MIAYGSSETLPCKTCPDQQPFCTTCNTLCDKKIDASCAVYHLLNPNAINHLTCLGLPNGVTVEAFMEAVDAAICNGITVTPVVHTLDTNSINLSGDGSVGTPLFADAIISPDGGNTLSIHSNGLYSSGAASLDCSVVQSTFVTDTAQKNTIDPILYDFLITGTAGCQKVSPPLGFAVSGTTRKSAFGPMEWFSTLALANASAASGETVLLFTDTLENLTAKNGVGYFGVGNIKINAFTASSVKCSVTNINIQGDLNVGGTSDIDATNVSIYGAVNFTGSSLWRGGRFYDNTTNIGIFSSAFVRNIYSEKAIVVVQSGTLSDFDIVYTKTTGYGLFANPVGAGLNCLVQRGTVQAFNLTSGLGAVNVLVSDSAKLIISDVIGESISVNGVYMQCGSQDNEGVLIATNITGKSEDGNGLSIAASKLSGSPDTNLTSVIIDHCVGYSITNAGISCDNANLKNCTGFSDSGYGIHIGGSDASSINLLISNCIAESRLSIALRCDKDIYILGGTFITRDENGDGFPIFLSNNVPTIDPSGTAGYVISGATLVKRNTDDNTYFVKAQASGIFARISGNNFVNPKKVGIPAFSIDPLITLRAVNVDAYGNIK